MLIKQIEPLKLRSVLLLAALLGGMCTAGAGAPQPPARPQDDFYLHVNQHWLDTAEIPPTVPWISPFVVITLRVQDRIKGLILESAGRNAASGTDTQRIGDLYRSFMDEARIERAGLVPIWAELQRVKAISNVNKLADAFTSLDRDHASIDPNSLLPTLTPLTLAVRADARNATVNIATLRPGGLGLPDRTAYLDSSQDAAELRSAYRAHIRRLLELSGVRDADAASDRIVDLETALAATQLTEEQLHDPAATYHPVAVRDLNRTYPGVPWARLLRGWRLENIDRLLVSEPRHLRALNDLMHTQPIQGWRDYLSWQLLRRYSPVLPSPFADTNFAFYDQRLLGNEVRRPRDEMAGLLVEGAFAEPLGRLYSERYLDPRTRADVTRMAETIRDAFRERIRAATWLESATKTAALQKLDKLLIKIAHPDEWENFSDVVIRPDDLIGNLRRLSARTYDRRIARLGRPVDRRRWLDVPQSTSAYYNRSTNEIAIPAGYLQAPWYDPDATPAANYGGIGTVIGHEMGHAFDDQGSHFNGDGNLVEWWTLADRARFEALIADLVAQYSRYEPLPGRFVNGRLTVSENVGDLTGVTLAHAALMRSMGVSKGDASEIERGFFLSFCVHWRAGYREPLLLRILSADGHPPQHYRCNGPLSNFAPFYRLYDVRSGDGMFRPERDRVVIW